MSNLEDIVQTIKDIEVGRESTKTVDKTTTVGATSTSVLAANNKRVGAVFTNNSSEDIYLRKGPIAELNKGILLVAYGGYHEINATNIYKGEVTAICTSGSKVLCVEEYER